jgi:predicted nucleic acid-binding protein
VRALFDVNVLIALLDENHVHHAKARSWLQATGHLGWSSCAITINRCVRIMSNAALKNKNPHCMRNEGLILFEIKPCGLTLNTTLKPN